MIQDIRSREYLIFVPEINFAVSCGDKVIYVPRESLWDSVCNHLLVTKGFDSLKLLS